MKNLTLLFILTVFTFHNALAQSKQVIGAETLRIGNASSANDSTIELAGTNVKIKGNKATGFAEFTNDGSVWKKLGSGSGSGSSGINLLSNPNFEDSVGTTHPGWTALAGTAVASSYTSGAENRTKYVTFTATAAGQCFESSLQAIPSFNEFKIGCMAGLERISADANFTINVLNSSNVSVLRNGAVSIPNSTDMFPLEPFSCPAAATTIKARICSTAAGSIQLQSVYVGSNKDISNTTLDHSDWVNGGVIPITAATTNPTKGTTTTDRMWWRRTGDSMQIRYEYSHGAGGSVGSGQYYFGIPAGYQIDTSKFVTVPSIAANVGYFGGRLGPSTVDHYAGTFYVQSSTTLGVYFQYQRESSTTAQGAGLLGSTLGSLDFANVIYSGVVTVPILGWKSMVGQTINNPSVAAAETSFSAYVSNTGVVTQENMDWINGNCSVNSGTVTCNFNSGIFTLGPSCQTTPGAGSSTLMTQNGTNASTLTTYLYTQTAAAGNGAFTVTCQKQGADYDLAKVYKLKTPILVGSNKVQIKILPSNISASTTDIASLRFSNLVIGKRYRITFQAGMQTQAGVIRQVYLTALHNGSVLGSLTAGSSSNEADNYLATSGTSSIFTATGSTVTFNATFNTTAASFFIYGNGAMDGTFAQLEELNNTDFTTGF